MNLKRKAALPTVKRESEAISRCEVRVLCARPPPSFGGGRLLAEEVRGQVGWISYPSDRHERRWCAGQHQESGEGVLIMIVRRKIVQYKIIQPILSFRAYGSRRLGRR